MRNDHTPGPLGGDSCRHRSTLPDAHVCARQPHLGHRAAPVTWAQRYPTILALENPANEIQAEPHSAVPPLIATLQLPEPLEGPLDVLRTDTDPPIGHPEPHRLLVGPSSHVDVYPSR